MMAEIGNENNLIYVDMAYRFEYPTFYQRWVDSYVKPIIFF